jgi:hypothetical protein
VQVRRYTSLAPVTPLSPEPFWLNKCLGGLRSRRSTLDPSGSRGITTPLEQQVELQVTLLPRTAGRGIEDRGAEDRVARDPHELFGMDNLVKLWDLSSATSPQGATTRPEQLADGERKRWDMWLRSWLRAGHVQSRDVRLSEGCAGLSTPALGLQAPSSCASEPTDSY